MKKLLLLLAVLLLPTGVFAAQISVPSAPSSGFFLQSLSTGLYSPIRLIQGSNITISTTTSSLTISATSGASSTLLFDNNTWTGSNAFANLFTTGSSTLQNFTFLNATGSKATTTSLFSTLASTSALYLNTASNMLKSVNGLVSSASNGTDYTLISATTCGGSDKVSAISASGAVTCTADQTGGGGSSFPFAIDTNYGQTVYSTSTPTLWLKSGLFASSTSHFVDFDFTNATGSKATTSDLYSSRIGTNSEYFTDLTGTGLSNSSGVLTVSNVPNASLSNSSISFTSTDSSLSVPASIALGASGAFTLNLTNNNIWTSASTTFVNGVTIGNATTTKATTTSLAVLGRVSQLLVTDANGSVVPYSSQTCTNQFARSQTAAGVWTCATVGANDVSLANLTATDATLTFSGTYNGSVARTIGLNLSNANTWAATQTFPNILVTGSSTLQNFTFANATGTKATTTNLFTNTASTTAFYAQGLHPECNGAGFKVTYTTAGQFLCEVDSNSTPNSKWATSSSLWRGVTPNGGTNINVGIGTSTPVWPLQVASSTRPQFALSDGSLTSNIWTMRNAGGNFYFATASPSTFATSTKSAFAIDGVSGTTYLKKLAISGFSENGAPNNQAILVTGSLDGDIGAEYINTSSGASAFANNYFQNDASFGGYIGVGGSGLADPTTQNRLFLQELANPLPNSGISIASRSQSIKFYFGGSSTVEKAHLTSTGFGIGTSTPQWSLTVASSTRPQLALTDGSLTSNIWTFRNAGGNFYFGTSSPLTFATSSIPALTIISGATSTAGYWGIGTTTPKAPLTVQGLIFSPEYTPATSTNMNIDMENGGQQLIRINASAVNVGINRLYPGATLRLSVCNGASTAGAITFHSSTTILWTGGTIPTQTTTAHKCDLWSFVGSSGSTTPIIMGAMTPNY